MVTSAADLGDLQCKPNNAYLPLHGIPFLKQQRPPLPYPWYGVLKKVHQVGVNMHYLVWRSPKSAAEVTIALSLVWDFQKGISCRGKYVLFGLVWFGGHPNQLQRSPLQCPWSAIFKKVYHVGVNLQYLVWFGLEVTQISCRGHHCNVLGLAFSKRYIM